MERKVKELSTHLYVVIFNYKAGCCLPLTQGCWCVVPKPKPHLCPARMVQCHNLGLWYCKLGGEVQFQSSLWHLIVATLRLRQMQPVFLFYFLW